MADSATAKESTRLDRSFARRYGLAFVSVTGALLLELLFHHFNLPHPFAAFALTAIAITFWYGGTKPGIVAVLLSSLIRGFIFEHETSSLSRVLYEVVFLTFAILMIWVRRSKDALEAKVADRTARLTAANEELHRQKEQLDRLFELSPVAVVVTDQNFHVLRVSQEFTHMFGYSPEETVGNSLYEMIVPEEFQEDTLKNMALVLSGKRLNLESVRRRKDGVRLDVSVVAKGISLGSGRVAAYFIHRDITERKKAERELTRSEGYLAEAQRLTHTGSWAWNVRTGALFWSQEVFRICEYDSKEIGPTWPQFLARVHPDDRPLIQEKAKMEATAKGWVDSRSDFRIALPDGTIKHLHSTAHPVTDEFGEIVEVVGTVMDVTEQWRARAELEKALEAIRRRTEDVRRSERELRDVVNTVAAHIWRTSPDGQADFVNDRWLQFTGLASEEAFGWNWQAVVHPEDRTRMVADWHAAIKSGQAMETEARVRRADGEYCWWLIRNVPLRDETGKLVRWYGTAIDIEDLKRAEQALRKSEERWRSVFENSAIGVALTDLKGRFLATNHVYQTMLGYTEEELRALYFLDLTHENYREANWALVTELLEGKREQFQIEKKYLRKDGSSIWVSNNVSLVPGTERVPRFIMALSEDITERKQAEDKLRRSEAYLANTQTLARTGTWVMNPSDLELIYWSREFYKIYGLDPAKDKPKRSDALKRIHPDDRAEVDRTLKEAIRQKTGHDVRFRLVLPDGTEKRIHSVARPAIDEAGNVIEMVGTSMDVTDEYEARAALETAFEQIKAEQTELRRMIDAIAAYIYVLRPDGTPLYANQTVLDYIGLTLEDVQREDHRARVLHPEDVERLRDECQEALARGKPFELEQRALGKDGKYRWFLVRHNPLRDDQGRIIRWYATGTDIEDRKQVEERIRNENLALREQIDQAFMFEEIVGASPALQSVLSSVVKVAPTDSTVLLTGETGTGKELIARAIHKRSKRVGRAFVSVNCAALAPTLISSELFGHEKGAFTGASQRRLGRFELADGGTIFLDEAGELPLDTQVALLRILQEREFERVGGMQSVRVNVRVITATNRDLKAAVAAGAFRNDLFYRLNVFPIDIPPLRERREDIPLLVEYFIDRFARKAGKSIRGINKKTLDLLVSYPWPGNIRELQNVVERSVIICETGYLSIDEHWLSQQPLAGDPKSRIELSEKLAAHEKEMIEAALHDTGGRISGPLGAAAKLGIHRSTLESKITSLKIDKYRFKSTSLSKRT